MDVVVVAQPVARPGQIEKFKGFPAPAFRGCIQKAPGELGDVRALAGAGLRLRPRGHLQQDLYERPCGPFALCAAGHAAGQIPEALDEAFQGSLEFGRLFAAVARPQAIGQIGPAVHLVGQRLEHPVALYARHVGLGQQAHELVGIVGLEPVVVDLPEQANAVREWDEIGPVDIDPGVVDLPAPADLGSEVAVG